MGVFGLIVQRKRGTLVSEVHRSGLASLGDGEETIQDIPIGEFETGARLRAIWFLDAFAESFGSPPVDPKVVEADMSISLCSTIAGVVIQGASGSVGDCAGDLEVAAAWVEPIQSVRNASKMVADKDTVLRLDLKNSFSHPVRAKLDFDIQRDPFPTASFQAEVVVPPGCPNGKRFYFPQPEEEADCSPALATASLRDAAYQLAPMAGSSYRVSVTLTPPVAEQTDNNSGSSGTPLVVKETDLFTAYTRAENPALYSSITPEEYDGAILWSDRHLRGMFPVAPQGYFGLTCPDPDDCKVPGSPAVCELTTCEQAVIAGGCFEDCVAGQCLSCPGIVEDIEKARLAANLLFPDWDRTVLLLSSGHQSYHGWPPSDVAGFVAPAFPTVVAARADRIAGLTTGFRLPIVPHEMVHSFGFNAHRGVGEVTPQGYWVGCQPLLPTGADCEVVSGAENLMEVQLDFDPTDVWIDNGAYDLVLTALKREPDPAILSIFGFYSKDGRYVIKELYELPSGSTDLVPPPENEDHRIHVLDGMGNILVTVTLGSTFEMYDPPVKDTGGGILGRRIPYPPEAARIQFLYKDQVVVEIDPLSRVLRDAILRVPDRGFDKNPEQRRKALLEKVEAFEKHLAEGKRAEAQEKLRSDIRDKIKKWIVDFEKPHTLEFTRDILLALIDRTLTRIDAQLAQENDGDEDDEKKDKKEKSSDD